MSRLNINNLFFILIALIMQLSLSAQNSPSDKKIQTLPETNQYLKRVNLDEGNVSNKDLLNSFLQLATKANWFNEIKFWTSAQWGVKEFDGTVAKQYELLGNDLTTERTDNRPQKIKDGDLLGLLYDGKNDYSNNGSFKAQHPLSMLLVFKTDGNNEENVLVDSKSGKSHVISVEKHGDENQLVIRTAGDVYVKGLRDGINVIFIEFNIKDSKVFVNGNLAYNGVIGKSEFNGIEVGEGKIKNDTKYFSGVIYETGIIDNLLNDTARTELLSFMNQVYKVN